MTNDQVSMGLAVKNLIEALDQNPRSAWPQTILMSLTAMRGLGHAEGFRTATSGPLPASTAAPANAKPPEKSHEELLEDRGFETFFRIIARRFGVFLEQYPDLDPESLALVLESINNEATGESQGHLLKLMFKKDAKTK